MISVEDNKITGFNSIEFDSKEILELDDGIYKGNTIDEEEVIISRQLGNGFTIGICLKEKPNWWLYRNYDENGYLEEEWFEANQ